MSDKITQRHLERAAYVYIRQSTLQQVRNNLESGRRQYALEDRARVLGFKQVVVIDDDTGTTGTGCRERPGFGRLLAEVGRAWTPPPPLDRIPDSWKDWPVPVGHSEK